MVGGGEDIPVDEEKEVEEPSLSRQQSAASDDVEAAPHEGVRRRRIPPREASEEMDNSSALSVHSVTPLYPAPPQRGEPDVTHDPNDRAPWPGSEFKIAQVLPDSVYLWACGEHEGDQGLAEKSVSTAGCVAAWVVLIVRKSVGCDSACFTRTCTNFSKSRVLPGYDLSQSGVQGTNVEHWLISAFRRLCWLAWTFHRSCIILCTTTALHEQRRGLPAYVLQPRVSIDVVLVLFRLWIWGCNAAGGGGWRQG